MAKAITVEVLTMAAPITAAVKASTTDTAVVQWLFRNATRRVAVHRLTARRLTTGPAPQLATDTTEIKRLSLARLSPPRSRALENILPKRHRNQKRKQKRKRNNTYYLRAARAERSADQRPVDTPTAKERAKRAAQASWAKAKKRNK